MGPSIVAVLGTLAGALVSGLLHHRAAARAERAARLERVFQERVEAVAALARAATDHRRTMYTRRHLTHTAASAEQLERAAAESYQTRSALAGPSVRLRLLTDNDGVQRAAAAMVTATYALRDSTGLADLGRLRAVALEAHDAFVDAAAASLHRG